MADVRHLDVPPGAHHRTIASGPPPRQRDYRLSWRRPSAGASLEGITFSRTGGDAFPITVNTANYARTTYVYPPSAELDPWGVVHLFGAVRQIAAGGDVNLVGTVPAFARPDRYVYELVSTELGTYADVVITPAGQIDVINPRMPLLTALGLISLEGISYQP